jgi:hypothetical protein
LPPAAQAQTARRDGLAGVGAFGAEARGADNEGDIPCVAGKDAVEPWALSAASVLPS